MAKNGPVGRSGLTSAQLCTNNQSGQIFFISKFDDLGFFYNPNRFWFGFFGNSLINLVFLVFCFVKVGVFAYFLCQNMEMEMSSSKMQNLASWQLGFRVRKTLTTLYRQPDGSS